MEEPPPILDLEGDISDAPPPVLLPLTLSLGNVWGCVATRIPAGFAAGFGGNRDGVWLAPLPLTLPLLPALAELPVLVATTPIASYRCTISVMDVLRPPRVGFNDGGAFNPASSAAAVAAAIRGLGLGSELVFATGKTTIDWGRSDRLPVVDGLMALGGYGFVPPAAAVDVVVEDMFGLGDKMGGGAEGVDAGEDITCVFDDPSAPVVPRREEEEDVFS
jgi:hypothetical protein